MTTISELNIGDTIRLEGGSWEVGVGGRSGIVTTVTGFDTDHRGHRSQALIETDRAHHVDDDSWPFVLVSRAGVPTTLADLRVGDRVRLVGGRWESHQQKGEIHTVAREYTGSSVDLDSGRVLTSDYPFEFVERPGSGQAEPAPKKLKEALAAGEWHPALLPLFEKFSKEACDAGYCPEYDRLARAAGAPTRAEVVALVAERDGREYRVRYTVPVFIDVNVTAPSEESARDMGFNATSEWEQIATILEARIAHLRDVGALYQLGNWSGTPDITAL